MANNEHDLIDQVREYFQANPSRFGLILVLVGVILLWGTLRKWKWIFEGQAHRLFNIERIRGQFGDRVAQYVYGLFAIAVIILGLGWTFIF